MPREGVFAEVVKDGRIHRGDEVEMELPHQTVPYSVGHHLERQGGSGRAEG